MNINILEEGIAAENTNLKYKYWTGHKLVRGIGITKISVSASAYDYDIVRDNIGDWKWTEREGKGLILGMGHNPFHTQYQSGLYKLGQISANCKCEGWNIYYMPIALLGEEELWRAEFERKKAEMSKRVEGYYSQPWV